MSILRRNNVQLRGTGDRAMVFAHGFGCDQRMWRHVARHFEHEFVTVLFDHVGSGGSDRSAYSSDKYSSLRGYARDLVELGAQVPFEKAVLVGHSCGAIIGALASIEAPDMFESLVLISPSPRYINDDGYVGGFSQLEIEHILEGMKENYGGWSADMAPIFMGNHERPDLAAELLNSFRENDPAIATEFARAIFNSDFRADLSRVAAECLVIQSDQDPVVPSAVGEYVRSQIENCRLQTVDVEGHFPHLSAPHIVVQCIRRFVAGSPPVGVSSSSPDESGHILHWPAASTRSSIEAKARRPAPRTDAEMRDEIEELLLKRAGELHAHLGRYDMYALTVEKWLKDGDTDAIQSSLGLRTRGAVIKALLESIPVATGAVAQFEEIHQQLLDILDRQEIAAKNCAVIPTLRRADFPPVDASPKYWYDYASATDDELLMFIDVIEKDILSVASLYIRLSNWASILGGFRSKG
jgi:sigma-B regulation protein RsbQ